MGQEIWHTGRTTNEFTGTNIMTCRKTGEAARRGREFYCER